MQGLFDDIATGNIGKTFKKLFEQMVFQMVATWILGMNGMRSASAGAMGGGAGGILGTLFGIGGGGGIFGSGGSSSDFATSIPLLGLGLSAGQGAGLPGLTLPSGAAGGGAAGALGGFGGLGGLLASPGFTNLALMGGAGLLIKSLTLGGGAKGALTG